MKNITVTVLEETHLCARIRAAQENTSVSALVRQFLESLNVSAFSVPAFLDDEEAVATPLPPYFL
jgi:plasmid stability protein